MVGHREGGGCGWEVEDVTEMIGDGEGISPLRCVSEGYREGNNASVRY